MNLAASHHLHDMIAGLLETQALLYHRAVVTSHLDGIGIAKEIRRVQHEDVERMAFDPFSAVKQAAQHPHCRINLDAQRAFHGMHRAHLISDGTDSANARRDIRYFREVPAPEERFKQSWRLEDFEFHIAHLIALQFDIERAFAFDPCEIIDLDSSGLGIRHVGFVSSLALRNCQAQALKLRKARVISALSCPRMWNWLVSDSVLGLSIGP